uniref:Peptidyl-glycine alpha-amidating monooxygenase A n=1 Tax=Phallusia mammillata TaxID=59560 RepID=A0A6F9DN74_9ASCI|nr:peptidyl-glycine alpha-amidating monooxygenase A [Phallusia mammillata]
MHFFVFVFISLLVSTQCQSLLDYLNLAAERELELYEYEQSRRAHRSASQANFKQEKEDKNCPASKTTYTGTDTASVDVRFPKASIKSDDAYLCTSFPVPYKGETSYVVGFTPQATMDSSHHMLVFGCETLPNDKPYWQCGMGQVCRGRRHTLYAWARNAPPLELPPDIGYKIGKSANINYLVVQIHYAHRLPANQYDCSGVTASVTLQAQKYFAGIFLLGAPYIKIPPHSNTSVDVSCVNFVNTPLHVFAFRTHAHGLGTVISGYRVRNGRYKMIGKGNPQWPHAFYTRVGGTIDLDIDDILLARCDYSSNKETVTSAGMGGNDEMCNFYMMYYTTSSAVANSELSCWGDKHEAAFPEGADDLAPFPGFAGQDSINAIASGKVPIPQVPDTHGHHHHHQEEQAETSLAAELQEKLEEETETPQKTSEDIHLVGNIKWSDKASTPTLGQVGGVAVDSSGYVHVFHRAYRSWDGTSFDYHNCFTQPNKPITSNTLYIYDPLDGTLIHQWGNYTFFMPHGVSLDHHNNVWLTDVGMHQVFKYQYGGGARPLLTLGVRMEPGNDRSHFCKPTDVAVDRDGTIFVSDGYCNGRVVKFSANGEFLKSWGRMSRQVVNPPPGVFNVAHSIALVQNEQHVCVADRENGRIQCFTKEGQLIKIIINHPVIGQSIYAISYSDVDDLLFAVNGPPSNGVKTSGFSIRYETGDVLDSWEPSKSIDLSSPHDVAVSPDGNKLYVGQLSPHKVYQFEVSSLKENPVVTAPSMEVRGREEVPLISADLDTNSDETTNLEEIKRPVDETEVQSPGTITTSDQEVIQEENNKPKNEISNAVIKARKGAIEAEDTSVKERASNESVNPNSMEDAFPVQNVTSADDGNNNAVKTADSTADQRFILKAEKEGISRNVTTAVVVVLVAIPILLFGIGLCYVRSRTRRLRKYEDFLVDGNSETAANKAFLPGTGKLNLGKFFNKSNPEQQGFKRVKTVDDGADDEVQTDEEPDIESQAPDYTPQEYHDESSK